MLLAALLLAAQQAALEHSLWHVAAAEQSKKSDPDPDPGRVPLCEQHAALGAVAGAIGCAGVAPAGEPPAAQAVAFAAASPASPASIAPTSRGPPALL